MANSIDTTDPTAFLRGGGTMGALIAAHDWSSTPLGPPRGWSRGLKVATANMLRSPVAMVILWGPDALMIYNDAYAAFIGDAHPALLGAKGREAWRRSVTFLDHVLELVHSGGSMTLHDREYTLIRSGQPQQVWMDVAYSPIVDESGQPIGALAVITDTTQRVLTERRAEAETARQRRLFEQAPGFISILQGPQHVFEFVNDTHNRLFGAGVEGKTITEAFPGDPRIAALLDHVYSTGERHFAQAQRVMLHTGPQDQLEEHYLDYVLEPITEETGEVRGVFCEGFDVTDAVRAVKAVRESERRLSAAFAIARLGAFEWDLENGVPTMDERAREIYGFSPDQTLSFQDITGRIDPEDLPRATDLRKESQARRQIEYRIQLPDGTTRHIASMSDCVLGPDDQVQRIIGVVADVTERRRAEGRQRMLINELNHRVKNTLATVQSIAAQTLRSAPDAALARTAFEARLVALAAAHDLLTMESWHGARMADVVDSATAPFVTARRPQIDCSGPAVWLTAPRALALSMALHELATNAVKYGALSRPEGHVTIRWSRSGVDDLTLAWTEEGGPPVEPPTRAGFGSRLLQRSLARELDGQVAFDFAPEGVRWELRFKIDEVAPPPIPAALGF